MDDEAGTDVVTTARGTDDVAVVSGSSSSSSVSGNVVRLVILDGGLPWGFRMQGGIDTGFPLRIARVNPGSKAALQGIREGDIIASLNGHPTAGVTNSQAHALLKKEAGPILRLGLKQSSTLTRRLFRSSESSTATPPQTTVSSSGCSTVETTSQSVPANGHQQNADSAPPSSIKLSTGKSGSSSALSTAYQASSPKPGVWSPGQSSPPERDSQSRQQKKQEEDSVPPPVWIPASSRQQPSPLSERKEFRPVRLDAAALKKQQASTAAAAAATPVSQKPTAPSSLPPFSSTAAPWDPSKQQQQQQHAYNPTTGVFNNSANSTPITTPASDRSAPSFISASQNSTNYSVLSWDRRTNASSSAYSGLLFGGGGGSGSTTPTPSLSLLSSTPTSHLPKAPNPTVTLLQKAREGQLPKGAAYLDSKPSTSQQPLYRSPFEQVYSIQREYSVVDSSQQSASTSAGDENSQQQQQPQPQQRKFVDLTANKFSGVGPVSQEGVPIALRSGIREEDHHHWYKRMYESLHRAGGPGDYVTVRYKPTRGRGGGYQSEPDRRYDYDSDAGRYATLDRRRQRIQDSAESNNGSPSRLTSETDIYRNQPGRIEDYEPGRSSLVQQQNAKQSPKTINIPSKSFTNFALKESGYESDSQLVFRRRNPNDSIDDGQSSATPVTDPHEQRLWYRDIQRGGEVPLHGLRKPQPDRPLVGQDGDGVDYQHDAPGAAHRFAESEISIHYRSPIRNLQQANQHRGEIDEEELRQIQAEHMKRVYEQERRRKYIQELEDIESRRHMDNFTPLMKSPIPLNRYDDFMDDQPVHHGGQLNQIQQQNLHRDRTPEPKIVARGLYNFVAQNSRELSFSKGDIIFVRRQVDKNWYEGEHNAMIGIFPVNYVEIVPYDRVQLTNRKPSEGKGRVKFNFVAQTPVELSLVKGEMVIIIRQVDEHWMEGRIGQRRGIFPISYVDILQPPVVHQPPPAVVNKPSSSVMTNGSLRQSAHTANRHQPPNQYASMPKMTPTAQQQQPQYRPMTATPYKPIFDGRSEPVLYRALYTYAPQNEDELELIDGDTICVLEKCDDGWYVGTSRRTGLFGTFPGNYVERI